MNAVIRVTNAGRVTQTEAAISGGSKDDAAIPLLCHTTLGGVKNRSLSRATHAAHSRPYIRRRARSSAWTAEASAVTGSEVSR